MANSAFLGSLNLGHHGTRAGHPGRSADLDRTAQTLSGTPSAPVPGNIGSDPSDPQAWNMYSYSLNDPISSTDPTGMYTCTDDNNACKSVNDQNFAQALKDARNAAFSYLSGVDLLSATNAINSYGDATADNGVSVGFATDLKGPGAAPAAGETTGSRIADGNRSAANPNGQNIHVTFDAAAMVGGYGASVAAHEGSHVFDRSQWVASGFSRGMDPTRYGTEIHAYEVQFNILQAEMARDEIRGGIPSANIGGVSLYQGQTWKDFMPAMQELLRTSPNYGFTYKDTKPAFQKEIQTYDALAHRCNCSPDRRPRNGTITALNKKPFIPEFCA